MVAEVVAGVVLLVAAVAETLHQRRVRRLAPLAFGMSARPRLWVVLSPWIRVIALVALVWGLTSLLTVKPKSFRPVGELAPGKEQHIVIVLDVSPSMRLEDAGPGKKQTRQERARDVMRSLFDRVPMNQYLVSVIAVYSGAKPVVVDSHDLEVVDGILGDIPLYQAFKAGETQLLEGLKEAANIAQPWNPRSTTIVLVSDGDTVPAQGMPKMPASVGKVLVVGVGDPHQGSFIAGRQSKQDAFTLRQIATRLQGHYHDANLHHLSSQLIATIVQRGEDNLQEPWSRREYALLAAAIGGLLTGHLPWILWRFGTSYLPGVRKVKLAV